MSRSSESDANNYSIVGGMNYDSSDASSGNYIPLHTHLGRRELPITTSCQELLDAIEKFRWDYPFVAEMIRQSKVYFSDAQIVLSQEVLDAADLIVQFGYEQRFIDELVLFERELKSRVEAEKIFFSQQKKRYTDIYEILVQSSFPYSVQQSTCCDRMMGALYELTGDPSSEIDKVFDVSLKALVRLLQSDDHLKDPSPYRMVVTNTIHFYLKKMVSKLEPLAVEERGRPHPDFIRPDSNINLAIYLVEQLGDLIDETKILTPCAHFHLGMVEIYTKFVEIFRKSGLDFGNDAIVSLQKVERRVRDLKKNKLIGRHYEIMEACLEFMVELEKNRFTRESKLEDEEWVLDPEGAINKALRGISWGLIYLQPVAVDHLANFPVFSHAVENVVARLLERFLDLYPIH